MKFTTREKINALINCAISTDELKERISKTDTFMNIFKYDELFEIISKLYNVRKDILSVIDRLNENEIVEK